MQEKKRQLVAMLSLNGFTYWGDFLDLQVCFLPLDHPLLPMTDNRYLNAPITESNF